MDSVKRIYERSGRHSEPITAQNPGVKCPPMSYSDAQKILDSAERVGNTPQATYGGVGFVARNEDNQRGRDLARVSGSMGQDGTRVEKTLAQTRPNQAQRYSGLQNSREGTRCSRGMLCRRMKVNSGSLVKRPYLHWKFCMPPE